MSSKRINAHTWVEVRATSREIPVLGIQGQTLGQFPADTGHDLPRKWGVIASGNNVVSRSRANRHRACRPTRKRAVYTSKTNASTDIWVIVAFRIEIENGVRHDRPDLKIAEAVFKAADSASIVVALSKLAFETEAVGPFIAQSNGFAPIALAIDFAIQRAGYIGVAWAAVTDSSTTVPAFVSKRARSRCQEGSDGDRRKKPIFHYTPSGSSRLLGVKMHFRNHSGKVRKHPL